MRSGTWVLYSDVGTLFRVAPQIPAGHVPCARKQRVDAGLRLWGIEEEFCLAVLLLHGVVGRDRDLAEGLAVRGDAIAEHKEVYDVSEQRQA